MKIRMRGNSIRLRLTQSEVVQIREGQGVVETVSFGKCGQRSAMLQYSLESSSNIQSLEARFEDMTIRILMPEAIAQNWVLTSEVSVKNHQDLGQGESLFILVEKDFVCLKPRAHEQEDEADLFVNPNEAHGSCG